MTGRGGASISTAVPTLLLPLFLLASCSPVREPVTDPVTVPPPSTLDRLEATLRTQIGASGAEVALYYRTLEEEPDSVLVNPDLRMHAASTMKVPVMMRLFLDDQEGIRSLDEAVEVTRTFRSIVDGSTFELSADPRSDTALHSRVGERVTMRELVERMITRSNNLATNLLIEEVGARRVTALMRSLGADSMEVLRGVEDLEAFEAGLSNTTTARDLGVAMRAVAESERFEPAARREMLGILERQHFREKIPAGLPAGTRVANKTGSITGIDHDAAVVLPRAAPPYVLVILIRNPPAEDRGTALAARLSRTVWAHHVGRL